MRRGGLFWGVARLREITRERELPEEQGKIELQGGKGSAPKYDFVDLFIYLFIYFFVFSLLLFLVIVSLAWIRDFCWKSLHLLVLSSGLF